LFKTHAKLALRFQQVSASAEEKLTEWFKNLSASFAALPGCFWSLVYPGKAAQALGQDWQR